MEIIPNTNCVSPFFVCKPYVLAHTYPRRMWPVATYNILPRILKLASRHWMILWQHANSCHCMSRGDNPHFFFSVTFSNFLGITRKLPTMGFDENKLTKHLAGMESVHSCIMQAVTSVYGISFFILRGKTRKRMRICSCTTVQRSAWELQPLTSLGCRRQGNVADKTKRCGDTRWLQSEYKALVILKL